MALKFVDSTRGKPLLTLQGFLYRQDKPSKEHLNWRCVVKTCRARITTRGDSHGVSWCFYCSRELKTWYVDTMLMPLDVPDSGTSSPPLGLLA